MHTILKWRTQKLKVWHACSRWIGDRVILSIMLALPILLIQRKRNLLSNDEAGHKCH